MAETPVQAVESAAAPVVAAAEKEVKVLWTDVRPYIFTGVAIAAGAVGAVRLFQGHPFEAAACGILILALHIADLIKT